MHLGYQRQQPQGLSIQLGWMEQYRLLRPKRQFRHIERNYVEHCDRDRLPVRRAGDDDHCFVHGRGSVARS